MRLFQQSSCNDNPTILRIYFLIVFLIIVKSLDKDFDLNVMIKIDYKIKWD